MRMLIAALTLMPVALFAQSQTAEDFMRMSQIIVPDADADYPTVRCGAFYRSLHLVFDDEVLGTDGNDKMTQLEKLFTTTAALVRQDDKQISDTDAVAGVTADVEALAGLYIERYRIAAQLGDNPFMNDPMLNEDNAFCTGLAKQIVASYD